MTSLHTCLHTSLLEAFLKKQPPNAQRIKPKSIYPRRHGVEVYAFDPPLFACASRLRPVHRDAGSVAVAVGLVVTRRCVDQRRVSHVGDREGHVCDVLGNPGPGHCALAAGRRHARAAGAADIPGAGHHGLGHDTVAAVVDGDRHCRCPGVPLFRAGAVEVAYVHTRLTVTLRALEPVAPPLSLTVNVTR